MILKLIQNGLRVSKPLRWYRGRARVFVARLCESWNYLDAEKPNTSFWIILMWFSRYLKERWKKRTNLEQARPRDQTTMSEGKRPDSKLCT